jgi:hypothetical protein
MGKGGAGVILHGQVPKEVEQRVVCSRKGSKAAFDKIVPDAL